MKTWVLFLWSVLWNKITTSLRLTVFYEWEKGNESSFFSMLGLIQTTVVSNLPMHRAAMKCISPIFFFHFVTLCQSSPFTTHNGTTHRTDDTCRSNCNLDWIQGEVKNHEECGLVGFLQYSLLDLFILISTVLLMPIVHSNFTQYLKLVWIYDLWQSF